MGQIGEWSGGTERQGEEREFSVTSREKWRDKQRATETHGQREMQRKKDENGD